MHPEQQPVEIAVQHLQELLGEPPPTAIVLGSGLGVVVERMTLEGEATNDAVGLPRSTVSGHAGRVLTARLGGSRVVTMSGRVHRYEGYPMPVVVRYVRALAGWGVKRLILTCSAGGIAEEYGPGSLVAISDHLNLQGDNPLIGPPFAERFPDLTHAYDPAIRDVLHEAAGARDVELGDGVYAAMSGPAYETPAEIRMLRTLGADLVGMSTVPEVLAAAEIGLPCAAVALVSNVAAGLSDEVLRHDEVTEVAGWAGVQMADLLEEACARFDD